MVAGDSALATNRSFGHRKGGKDFAMITRVPGLLKLGVRGPHPEGAAYPVLMERDAEDTPGPTEDLVIALTPAQLGAGIALIVALVLIMRSVRRAR